jgi:hypothetical protein
MADPTTPSRFCATLVVDEAITKLQALDAIAEALQVSVQHPGTRRPFVPVGEDAWAEIEIPKFGEAPPLSIDVYSVVSAADAEVRALTLMAQLSASTSWVMRPMFAH